MRKSRAQNHKRAIEIVSDWGAHDWRQICVEIAKDNPAALVHAVDKGMSKEWYSKVKAVYDRDGKIAAIKELRSITGKGLKEAKELVETTFSGGSL